MDQIETQCCIAGGGPAGLMLGYLLARAGVPVVVLEKHADFLRDFRGDTIHPSTLELLRELGDLPEFLTLPHTKFHQISLNFDDREVLVADFSALPVEAGYVAMMPQWDFLDFLADRARTYANFRLIMRAEVIAPVMTNGTVTGVTVRTSDGDLQVNAALTVAADGRSSTLRTAAGMQVTDFGAPIDVMWFRLSRRPEETRESLGRIRAGKIFVMLNRGDYWQCAHVVAKGEADQVRAAGLPAFRALLDRTLGLGNDRSAEIADWDQVKTLDVQVNRLNTWWRDGLLFIGDAAHAMSPIGGIGINLAIQDAVAAANIIAGPLKAGATPDLAAVQARRLFPTRVTQRVQVLAQNRIIAPTLAATPGAKMPLPFRLLARFPWLRQFPARFVGLGIRREHPDPQLFAARSTPG